MAEFTLEQAYSRAASTNSLHNRNLARNQFLLSSYQGGDDFRAGAYLHRYQLESDAEYQTRLRSTPLDNQCRGLISLYISFLFREDAIRDGDLFEVDPIIDSILEDADLDGRSMNAFMQDVAVWSSVFGMAWVCVAKPSSDALTLADEIALGIRPYLSVYTPLTVVDWCWTRTLNGRYELSMIKVIEEINDSFMTIKEWTKDYIITTIIDTERKCCINYDVIENGIGRIPFIPVYAERSHIRGIGVSMINDIADQQLMIANELSEIYDSIKLDSHPSLVATESTNITGAAAGQVITLPEAIDPALKPYVLQFQGGQIGAIYESINNRIKMIDSMGNVGSVRATESTTRSGISIQTEFQLLNARLSSIASNLGLAEEQIWKEVCNYIGRPYDGEIEYPSNFALHNVTDELDQLAKMKALATIPEIQVEINRRVAEILDIEIIEQEPMDTNTLVNPVTGQSITTLNQVEYSAALAQGYINSED